MKSDQIAELATALAKVQGNISHAVKDAENPFFKNKYADLASVWEACRTQLSENGLSIVQLPNGLEDGCLVLDTTMLHSSGQWISSRIKMPLSKSDPQGYGSTLTYARRYALAAIVGVYQDDDDAEGAKKPQQTATKPNVQTITQKANAAQATKPQSDPVKISDMQVKSLIAKYTKEGLTAEDFTGLIGWKYGVKEAKELVVPQFAQIMNSLHVVWGEYVAELSKSG